jgi:hypothetical protein
VLYVRNVEYTAYGKKSLAQCAFLAVNMAAWDVSNFSQEEKYTFPQREGICTVVPTSSGRECQRAILHGYQLGDH